MHGGFPIRGDRGNSNRLFPVTDDPEVNRAAGLATEIEGYAVQLRRQLAMLQRVNEVHLYEQHLSEEMRLPPEERFGDYQGDPGLFDVIFRPKGEVYPSNPWEHRMIELRGDPAAQERHVQDFRRWVRGESDRTMGLYFPLVMQLGEPHASQLDRTMPPQAWDDGGRGRFGVGVRSYIDRQRMQEMMRHT
eukprot:tig00000459_g1142.t1